MTTLGGLIAYRGAFAWVTREPISRYNGIFLRDKKKRIRVIEHLSFLQHATKIENHNNKIFFETKEGSGSIEFCSSACAKIICPQGKWDLILDCKEIYDERSWARWYTVHHEKNRVTIVYKKGNDPREKEEQTYDVTITIDGIEEFEQRSQFRERTYVFDRERGSEPSTRWVFDLGTIKANEITIALNEERKEMRYATQASKSPYNEKKEDTKQSEQENKRKTAKSALQAMIVDDDAIAAGYPWFFESWTRDELIALRGFAICQEKKLVRNVLFKYLTILGEASVLPSKYPASDLGAADSLGWWCTRVDENLELFNFEEQKEIAAKLDKALTLLYTERYQDGLITNKALETWMDTGYKYDTREGACIEIQALTLRALALLEKLTGREDKRKEELLHATRVTFIQEGCLIDRKEDKAIRPNTILAHYIYPELADRAMWEKTFDKLLEKNWLPWGGISTINKDHELFHFNHTGQNNNSYHRGDAWYWINHLCARQLGIVNKMKYAPYIKVIKQATEKAMQIGADHHIPEITSAEKEEAKGCIAQTWSMATWIELLHDGESNTTRSENE